MLVALHIERSQAGLGLPDLAFGQRNLLGARTGLQDFKPGLSHFHLGQRRLVSGFGLSYPNLRFLRVVPEPQQIVEGGFGVILLGHRVIQVGPGFPHVGPGIVPGRAGRLLLALLEGVICANLFSGYGMCSAETMRFLTVFPIMLAQFIYGFAGVFQGD